MKRRGIGFPRRRFGVTRRPRRQSAFARYYDRPRYDRYTRSQRLQ